MASSSGSSSASIVDRLRRLLDTTGPLTLDSEGEFAELDVWVATAVLLLEIANGDEQFLPKERRTILRILRREFGILRRDAVEVADMAEEARRKGMKLEQLTTRIRESYGTAQRLRIAALLWKVVLADGRIDEWEEIFANRAAELVGVTPEQAREARLVAERGEI